MTIRIGVLILMSIWGVVITDIWTSFDERFDGVRSDLTNGAEALEAHALRVFEVADRILRTAGSNPSERATAAPFLDGLTVTDRRGVVLPIAPGLAAAGRDLSDRSYVAVPLAASRDALFIGEPVRHPQSGHWMVMVSLRRPPAAGDGVVIARVDMTAALSPIAANGRRKLAVLDEGGRLLSQVPETDGPTGHALSDFAGFPFSAARPAADVARVEFDGDSCYAVGFVAPAFGLRVVAAIPKVDILAPWLGSVILRLAVAIGLSVLTVLGASHFRDLFRQLTFARRALIRSGTLSRTVLATVVEGVVTLGHDGHILLLNPAAERMFGFRAAEIVGRHVSVLMPAIGPLVQEWSTPSDVESTEQARVVQMEMMARCRNGGIFPADVCIGYGKAADIDDGSALAFVVTVRDATARRRHEQRLMNARRVAEESSKAKTQFLAKMSHELRTPLNAVIGFAELIETDGGRETPEQTAGFATEIVKGGRNLLEIINGVLEYAEIEDGQFELSIEAVNIARVVDSAIEAVAPAAQERRIAIERHLMPTSFYADRRAIRRMMGILLSNAVKYNRENGRVDVTVKHLPTGGVLFTVADTGIGIARDALHRVVEPFQQADNRATRSYGGVGLGLAICRQLIELHGGALTLDSVHGIGTTATLWFPARRAKRIASRDAASANATSS